MRKFEMNIQLFATPVFNPDAVTIMSSRTGAVPNSIEDEILTDIKHGSAFMQLAKAVPVTSPEHKFTYMTGVGAYWVDEAQCIKTEKPGWTTVTLRSKKLGVIIPTTRETLNHSVTNFFEVLRPEIAEAFSKKIDAAAFADVDNPFQWSITKSATAAGHVIEETANKYDDLNDAMGAVEASNYDPNGVASLRCQKRKYRSTKDASGQPIFSDAMADLPATLLGQPTAFLHNAAFTVNEMAECVGDWNQAVYGILRGIEYEVLTEATLTGIEASDAPGMPLSLAERDMVALKATMEVGMMVINDDAFAVVKKVG